MATAEEQPKVSVITVMTSDNQTMKLDRDVAERSLLIKNLLEDMGEEAANEPIPLPNVCVFSSLSVLVLTNSP